MELYFIGRFHAQPGIEQALADAISEMLIPTRQEQDCIDIKAFRSIRDSRLFYIHSHWKSEESFEKHATMPHTVRYLSKVEKLIDHPLDVNRLEKFG